MRHPNRLAIDNLNALLKLPFEPWMQDWEIQLADPNRVNEFCQLYTQLDDEDEKFTLMALIIASLEESLQEKGYNEKLVEMVNWLLNTEFALHQDTIEYWCDLGEDNPEHYWMVTPAMRKVWQENTV